MLKRLINYTVFGALYLSSLMAADKPNFVIVLADDVAWSSFGCNDAGLYTNTPNIDKLAKQSVRFTNFSGAVAQCGPIRHELYTGLLPPTSGIYTNGHKPSGEFNNIANYLGDLGYRVGLAGKSHFKRVTDFIDIPGFAKDANHEEPTWEMSGVKQFLETSKSKNKPFCMVVASVNAHHPWTIGDYKTYLDKVVIPPHMVDTPATRESLARHAAEVEDLDRQVGETMKIIDEMNLADNTVFIFLSEQGTSLPNGKWSIYDYGTKGLCLARWPGKFAPAVTDGVAMYCDVSATLIDIAGGDAPAIDGKSFFSVLKGETSDHRDHAFLVHQAGGFMQRAIRSKEFKLIWSPKQENPYYVDTIMNPSRNSIFAVAWREWLEKAKTDSDAQMKADRLLISPEFELYDLKNDPWEMNNLATNPEYAQVVKQMHEKLKADMKEMNDEFSSIDPKDAKKAKKAKMKEQGQDPKKKKSAKKKGSDSDQSNKANKKKKREKKIENK